MKKTRQPKCDAGFSLMELLIVMSVLAILATIAIPSYQRHTIKAREAVLAENLYLVRSAIDAFFADKGSYPNDLDELVTERYIRAIPKDPFTDSFNTWGTVPPEASSSGLSPNGLVYTIVSGSNQVGLNGVRYSEW